MAAYPAGQDRLALFAQMQRLTPEGMAALTGPGLLRHEAFDPTVLTRAIFPEVEMDSDIAGFERRLREGAPAFYRRNGL